MNTPLLFSLALRSFAPPAVGLIVLALWRRSSASSRRLVWILSVVVLAIMPVALMSLPSFSVTQTQPLPVPLHASAAFGPSSVTTGLTQHHVTASVVQPIQEAPIQTIAPIREVHPAKIWALSVWNRYGLIVWAIGVLLVLTHGLLGLVRLTTLRLKRVRNEEWARDLKGAAEEIGLSREPVLFTCEEIKVPMVFGYLSPKLVLPPDVGTWTPESRRAIFLHECAHILRMDWPGLLFSRLVTAIYWFNPLVWLSSRQYRAECEAAADDVVLLAGVAPSTYASELLQMASYARPTALPGALAIVEAGSLKIRINRLLDKSQVRRAASPRAAGVAIALSLALAVAFGFSYDKVGQVGTSNDGYADLGRGRHIQIIAIVKDNGMHSQAWNMKGELLPNSFPLPTGDGNRIEPEPDNYCVVFAQNFPGPAFSRMVAQDNTVLRGIFNLETLQSTVPGYGYYERRLDESHIGYTAIHVSRTGYGSIRCNIWKGDRDFRSKDELKPDLIFDHIPFEPTGTVADKAQLGVTVTDGAPRSDAPGALIGVSDLDHPEWGYWRPDGTPLPKIDGVYASGRRSDFHPIGPMTRRIGFLMRSREGSQESVAVGDVSGLLITHEVNSFHTPSGRYDLNEVFIAPNNASMRLYARVPRSDKVVEHVSLTRIDPNTANESVQKFFSNRIGLGSTCFAFHSQLPSLPVGQVRSQKFMFKQNQTPKGSWVDYSTDWEDGVVAIHTQQPNRIIGMDILEHGHDYYTYPRVALKPGHH